MIQEVKSKVCIQCGCKKSYDYFYGNYRHICKECYKKRYIDYYRLKKKSRNYEKRVLDEHVKIIYELYNNIKPISEDKMEIEDEYCSEFGCGRKLRLFEKLRGKKCINHSIPENLCVEYR